MSEEPENLILIQLRDLRRENAATMESLATAMTATHRVYERLEEFHDDIAQLRHDLSDFRSEMRKSLLKVESDLVSLEGQNICRRGVTLNITRRIEELLEGRPPGN